MTQQSNPDPPIPAWLLAEPPPAQAPRPEAREPEEIDYTAMPLGKQVRLPKGEIAVCTECGRHGLRLVYSARRGKYDIAYWHESLKEHVGFAPTLTEGCSIKAPRLAELPKAERERL